MFNRMSLLGRVVLFCSVLVPPAICANFTVNSTATTTDINPGDGICDDGASRCTLRAAIMEANALAGADTINLAAGASYTLATAHIPHCGLPPIRSEITIIGNGATIQRSTAPATPLFSILCSFSANLTLKDVTVSGGSGENAGGLYNDTGTTTIIGSTFSGNQGISGGGILNLRGTLIIQNSTISGNTSGDGFGGGGILSIGPTAVINSTIAENRADAPPGFRGRGDAIAYGPFTVKNSIIASPNNGLGDDCYGTVLSLGHNLASDNSCGLSGPGDLNNTNPLLGALADNGGSTMTRALLAGSPAINAVPVSACTDSNGAPLATDQRGITRPQGAACDIGAFELGGGQPLLTITKSHTGNFTQGQAIANFLITVTNSGTSPTVGTVRVTDDLSGAPGLTVVNFAGFTGTKWVCSSLQCTRSDPLAPGASYDPIQLTVSVAANASSPQVNRASVSGGGITSFSTFSPGYTYDGQVGQTVGDGALQNNAGSAYAVPFMAGSTAFLDSIVMGATHCGTGSFCGGIPPRDANSNDVIMSLYDNGATGGGNLLESIAVRGQMEPWRSQNNAIVAGTSVSRPQLVAGATYWLVATVPNMLTDATVWSRSTNSQGLTAYLKTGAGPWTLFGTALTFQINTTQSAQPVTIATATDSVIVNPAFALRSLTPNSAPSGASQLRLQANGSAFRDGAVVQWTSPSGQTTSLTTAFRSAALLEATVPASLLTTSGTAQVAAINPGGAVSNSLPFALLPPSLMGLAPSSAPAGGRPHRITATGANFLPNSVVRWTSPSGQTASLPTMFRSAALLEAVVVPSALTTPGTAQVAVMNPGGAVSNPLPFTVQ